MDKNLEENAAPVGVVGAIKAELGERRREPRMIIYDALVFCIGFVFSRFHLLWGAYPLAISYIAAAPVGVWSALVGAIVGSISLGQNGIIYAMLSVIVVFLRVVISGGDGKKNEGRALFSEPIVLRVSAAVIGAFIGSVYEFLLGGLSSATILFALAFCLLSGAFTVAFYGLFSARLSFFEVVFGNGAVFERTRRGREKYNWIFFQGSFLVLIFFISLSLSSYTLLGIDLAFVFASLITLFAAKRFGAVRAMAIGFVASFGVSAEYSVAFALLGLGAGFLFPVGHAYAFLLGGALLGAWSSYVGGIVGFLSTLPEFAVGVALFLPFNKSLSAEKRRELREDTKRVASDMVGSMALSHRNERGGSVDRLSTSVSAVAACVRRFGKEEREISKDEIAENLLMTLKDSCAICPNFASCVAQNPAPCVEIIDELSTNIYTDSRASEKCKSALPEYCLNNNYIFERISSSVGELFAARYKNKTLTELAEEYELLSKMINESRTSEEREYSLDRELSEKLCETLSSHGLADGVVKVFGERKKRFILAGEDKFGDIISSRELKEEIEKISELKLGIPEFFRKGDIALMDCLAAPRFAVEFAESSLSADGSEVSGDTARSFVSDSGYFYALLSDGMGSGEGARETSLFVSDFLSSMLSASVSENTALHVLNHVIGRKHEECSASVDLFRFDLLRGEAIFIKSGAACSYVKREGSLFRIRSETAPLGLMRAIDSERIRVECREGDVVIMLSDGITDSKDAVAWLPELLSKSFQGTISEYADYIISEAAKRGVPRDDMSVALVKIKRLE